MKYQDITNEEKVAYNKTISHPLQTFEWGEFRKKTHLTVIRKAVEINNNKELASGFQLTIHKIPNLPFKIGYLPKGPLPTPSFIEELKSIGKKNNCIFIKLEPNVINIENFEDPELGERVKLKIENLGLRPAVHPLFTKYTFLLDLTKSEEELLKDMHPKTRYNIKIAEKYNVTVKEDNSDAAFKEYLRLTEETTKRQGFYAHTKTYHELMWESLRVQSSKFKVQSSYPDLTAHLLRASFNKQTLVAWIVFVFKDTLYYPYGASSDKYREVMASTLMMWEAIKFGKKLGLSSFDMWGSLGENPNSSDPWFGFHRFKKGFGPKHVEFIGSYDLILNPLVYGAYGIADMLRTKYLQTKRRLS